MNILSRVGIVAGTLLVGAAGIAPAQAQSWSHTDATGDVTTASCDSTGDNCTQTAAPTAKVPDVVRFVADHRARRVNIYARYADLTSGGTQLHQVRYVTNEGVRRHFTWVTQSGHTVLAELDRDSDGHKVACSGIRRSIDYTANTIKISVPRSCLSAPRTVRVGFGSVLFTDISDPSSGFRYDDALHTGATSTDSDLVLGPSLRRA